jgi:hypothetical protein
VLSQMICGQCMASPEILVQSGEPRSPWVIDL